MEGVVRSVGFAPVKGMRHLDLDHVDLDEQGAVGDRAYCLVDVERRRVLRTVQHPSLMSIVAESYDDDGLALTLPTGERIEGQAAASGETITCDYWGRAVDLALTVGPHAELITAQLGRDVRLARAPRTAVVFGDPITVVTTASLRQMGGEMGVEAARFRATLVLDTDDPWVEDTWLGQEIDLGGATVRVGGPVPRCTVIDHHPETGEKDARILQSLVRQRPTNRSGEPMFGVYATVTRPGRVGVTR
ncbi:MOSC domain-containing protein [Nocardioides glacieisoli]|uniref:MOSC domain-containing protein n=1 Tax=Nocardioides glacieisoli TaxID=1168730 RepID=A0A4Q2RTU4_9ACTN|nr:MOSC N-terminal beta barrel domain-containing protein [Nocardioides glacieisoli]RYB92511.1 MOSC domain-containing protein [Nocardioides glacieisoli]